MTVIDELLVLLDDKKVRTLEECSSSIPGRTKQTLSSTLGRLTAKGWVNTERDRLKKLNIYSITEEGQDRVTNTLKHLRLVEEEWNGHWLFVLFNIPEKDRKYRDILRNRLMGIGFGRAQNSVWVAARDIRFEFEDLLETEKISSCTTILYPKLTSDESASLAKSFEWSWDKLDQEYQDFQDLATNFLSGKIKDELRAKTLVYLYAKLLAQDPKFSPEFEPKNYSRTKAHEKYLKIRPYCYTE